MVRRRRPLSLPYEDQVPRLVSLLGAPSSNPAGVVRVEPLGASDADRFVDAALYHHLAGYAAAATRSGALALPTAPRRRLGRAGALRILQSRFLRDALAEAVPVLREACGTPPILLKGPAIADRFYPQPRLRPFVDLDLLVPRATLPVAIEAMRRLGYRTLAEYRPGVAEAHGHDVHLRASNGSRSIDVELHWRIQDDPVTEALDHARLLSRADPLQVRGASVAVPAAGDQLLCLAVHLLSDRTKRLAWVNDISLVGRAASDREWRRAFEAARELGLGWVLHRALDYAQRHVGLDRPRPLAAGAPPPFGPLRAAEGIDAQASRHLGRLAAIPWRERPRYLWAVVVPTRDWLRRHMGQDGAPTWRLVARHVRAAATSFGSRQP